MNRNERPERPADIARVLGRRFDRIHSRTLTERMVEQALAGSSAIRREIEQAGGGSLLPPVRRSYVSPRIRELLAG